QARIGGKAAQGRRLRVLLHQQRSEIAGVGQAVAEEHGAREGVCGQHRRAGKRQGSGQHRDRGGGTGLGTVYAEAPGIKVMSATVRSRMVASVHEPGPRLTPHCGTAGVHHAARRATIPAWTSSSTATHWPSRTTPRCSPYSNSRAWAAAAWPSRSTAPSCPAAATTTTSCTTATKSKSSMRWEGGEP